jgi:hypothetical protein
MSTLHSVRQFWQRWGVIQSALARAEVNLDAYDKNLVGQVEDGSASIVLKPDVAIATVGYALLSSNAPYSSEDKTKLPIPYSKNFSMAATTPSSSTLGATHWAACCTPSGASPIATPMPAY